MAYEDVVGRYVHVATSPDGYAWTRGGRASDVGGFADTQVGMLFDAARSEYVIFGRQDGPALPNSTVGCAGGYPSERRVMVTTGPSAAGGFPPTPLEDWPTRQRPRRSEGQEHPPTPRERRSVFPPPVEEWWQPVKVVGG